MSSSAACIVLSAVNSCSAALQTLLWGACRRLSPHCSLHCAAFECRCGASACLLTHGEQADLLRPTLIEDCMCRSWPCRNIRMKYQNNHIFFRWNSCFICHFASSVNSTCRMLHPSKDRISIADLQTRRTHLRADSRQANPSKHR